MLTALQRLLVLNSIVAEPYCLHGSARTLSAEMPTLIQERALKMAMNGGAGNQDFQFYGPAPLAWAQPVLAAFIAANFPGGSNPLMTAIIQGRGVGNLTNQAFGPLPPGMLDFLLNHPAAAGQVSRSRMCQLPLPPCARVSLTATPLNGSQRVHQKGGGGVATCARRITVFCSLRKLVL